MSLLVLSANDVENISSSLSPSELQYLMARVFALFSSGSNNQVATPHRTSIPTSNHNGTTIKVVSVPKCKDDTRGLPGSTLVLDEDTGAVKAIVNARNLTALRNAAGSLLSTNLVGLRTPQRLVAFGAGKQIEAHIDLHIRYFPTLRSCTIINRSINQRVESLRDLLQSRFPHISFTFLARSDSISAEKSVRAADLIICATSSTSPLFLSSWVDADLVMRAICTNAIPRRQDLNARISRALIVDSRKDCEIEAGELISANVQGHQVVEIGELAPMKDGEVVEDVLNAPPPSVVLDDAEAAHTFDGPVTMFKSVGIGLQDVAIACAVVYKAQTHIAVGTRISEYDST
ncbi:hypothetical protein BDQ17DRAFT_1393088 [Cyathus striatus]|nr:hypothetical protein BDQ17DRAFT_1393088 [Cyathus striatus]